MAFAQNRGNRYQVGDKNPYDKNYWRTKNTSSVATKVTQSLIVQKEILKTARKKIIEEAMVKSPEIVDPVNQASLTSSG